MQKECGMAGSLNQQQFLFLSPSEKPRLVLPQEAPQIHILISAVNKLLLFHFHYFPERGLGITSVHSASSTVK